MFQLNSIRKRILFAFSIVGIIIIAYAAFNYKNAASNVEQTNTIVNQELQLLTVDYDLSQTIALRIAAARGYVLSGNPEYKNIFLENVEIANERAEDLRALINSEDFEKYDAMADEWSNYIQTSVFDVYDAGREQLAINNLVTMDNKANEIQKGFESLATKRSDIIHETGQAMISNGYKAINVIMLLGLLTIAAAIIVASISASRISKSIVAITNRMKNIARGDFSEPPVKITSKDELAQLTEATNSMVQTMNTTLHAIQLTSNDVAAHSEELTQSSLEVKHGTDQISETVVEIARGTESQASHAADVAATMASFSEKINDVSNRSQHVTATSTQVQSLTSEGQHLMNDSTKQMAVIDTIVKDAVEKVDELNKETQEISQIVQVIRAIAEQTNLLSLNAAIEAARAGEHGKGFAVVADEVRKLADQVTHSVDNITTIVERILNGSTIVTSSLQAGYKEVERGTTQITMTEETFAKISASLNDMSTNIIDMSQKLHDVVENTATIHQSVDEIAAVSQQSAAGIEETSATIEQTSSTMDEISNSASTLAQMAESLNEQVREFKLQSH